MFSLALSRVFNPEDDTPALDQMEPDDIASLAMMLGYGITAEPRIEWLNAVTVVDTAFVTRKEWETLRKLGIGSSDAAVILGISPYRSMQAFYHGKRGTTFAMKDKPDPGKIVKKSFIDRYFLVRFMERIHIQACYCVREFPKFAIPMEKVKIP